MNNIYDLENYYFDLPKELIAQEPVFPGDNCRLLILDRRTKKITQDIFRNLINFLSKEDVLILNDTKVIKAKLFAKKSSGAKIEILLIKKIDDFYLALARPLKRIKIGNLINFSDGFEAKILDKREDGTILLDFFNKDIEKLLENFGKTPLPHYIKKDIELSKYQTVYAQKNGSIAAPTAGLHFTKELIDRIEEKKVKILYITLHCGPATFRPIKKKDIRGHKMEPEYVEIKEEVAEEINKAKRDSKRIIAVGTTTTRALESVSVSGDKNVYVRAFSGDVNLYITYGYKFKIVDGLITNFHTPYSTNLVLVSSFCGLDFLKEAYNYAIKERFRFFSFGDAMFII